MMPADAADRPLVVIVGGGLAGLAAASALADLSCRVCLLEARRSLGGRATSFRDPATDEMVDHCQHVGMACCTNLVDFARRTKIAALFRRDRVLHFIGPDGTCYRFAATRWLPAPLHLAPGFWRLKYLSRSDRISVARAFAKLVRLSPADESSGPTVLQWLESNGQSHAAIAGFWSVVLVSALGESLDRASLFAARKVIVDGFLSSASAYQIDVPQVPLGELYGGRLAEGLGQRGVELRLGAAVRNISFDGRPIVQLANGETMRPDFVIVAVPWSKVPEIVDASVSSSRSWLPAMSEVPSAPITGVHLWFDRPIMNLPHAVLVGRLSQWIFNRGRRESAEGAGHYYQVVISASYALADRQRDQIAAQVQQELAAIWPEASTARLLHARVVTEHGAVFSPRPGVESLRPSQTTSCERIYLAGDWTDTGWPATMESAVRSGYLAAEGIARALGSPKKIVVDDLPRGLLARLLIR